MAWNFNHTNVHDSCGGKVACVARDLAIAELFSKIINTRHTFIISEMARRGKEVSYLHTLAIWIIGVLLTILRTSVSVKLLLMSQDYYVLAIYLYATVNTNLYSIMSFCLINRYQTTYNRYVTFVPPFLISGATSVARII